MSQVKLFKRDIKPGVFVIQGNKGRLVTKVDQGRVTYCKFSSVTGEPYGELFAMCQTKRQLVWADRLASPVETARYKPELIIAASHQAAEKLGAELWENLFDEGFLAELERQRSERRPTR